MKDYKVRQILYNKLNEFDDNLMGLDYLIIDDPNEIARVGADYFLKPMDLLIYPSKSFSVAIIYAHLLKEYFAEDFFNSLNSEDLFCGNDRFFIPYDSAKDIYDVILTKINYNSNFKLNFGLFQIKKTVDYFKSEFSV